MEHYALALWFVTEQKTTFCQVCASVLCAAVRGLPAFSQGGKALKPQLLHVVTENWCSVTCLGNNGAPA